jgi:hypothetical protein
LRLTPDDKPPHDDSRLGDRDGAFRDRIVSLLNEGCAPASRPALGAWRVRTVTDEGAEKPFADEPGKDDRRAAGDDRGGLFPKGGCHRGTPGERARFYWDGQARVAVIHGRRSSVLVRNGMIISYRLTAIS